MPQGSAPTSHPDVNPVVSQVASILPSSSSTPAGVGDSLDIEGEDDEDGN